MGKNFKPQSISLEDTQILKMKAVDSFFVLAIRRILMQVIQTVSSILLARLLFPDVFGLYALLLFFLSIFLLFTDIGLSVAIIRDKKEPTVTELRAIFTTHILLGSIATILFWYLAPALFSLYNPSIGRAQFIVQLSSLAIFFYNLKLVPQSLLERKINYRKIVIGEVGEILIFNICTVFLVINEFGFASFVWGLLISRLGAAIIFFVLQPWKIGFSLAVGHLRRFLSFGFSSQISSFSGTLSGAIAPVVVGGISGVTALGLVNWAGGVAALPRVLGEIIARIVLPIGARSQNDPVVLKKIIERAIHFISIVSFPLIAIFIVLAKPITYIVFTDKWLPGLGAFYIFALYGVLAILQDVFIHALLAVGYAKTVRNVTVITVILQWILSYFLVLKFGFIGLPIAWLLTGFNCIFYYRDLRKKAQLNIATDLFKTLLLSVLTGIAVFLLTLFFPVTSIWHLMGITSIGLILYVLIIFYLRRKMCLQDMQLARELIIDRILKNRLLNVIARKPR